jgi:hypothetical protein
MSQHDHVQTTEQPSLEPQPPTCPWCAYTDVLLKKVLNHMESAHQWRWCDLALSPLIMGHGPV